MRKINLRKIGFKGKKRGDLKCQGNQLEILQVSRTEVWFSFFRL